MSNISKESYITTNDDANGCMYNLVLLELYTILYIVCAYHVLLLYSCRGYSCYARATITLVNFANEKDNHSKGAYIRLRTFMCWAVPLIYKAVNGIIILCLLFRYRTLVPF